MYTFNDISFVSLRFVCIEDEIYTKKKRKLTFLFRNYTNLFCHTFYMSNARTSKQKACNLLNALFDKRNQEILNL